eukprot:346305-Hanusia_phi.AAC.1
MTPIEPAASSQSLASTVVVSHLPLALPSIALRAEALLRSPAASSPSCPTVTRRSLVSSFLLPSRSCPPSLLALPPLPPTSSASPAWPGASERLRSLPLPPRCFAALAASSSCLLARRA